MAKVQISLDDSLLNRCDNYADNNYMSRSGLISVALTDYLNQKEAISSMREVTLAVKKIADAGVLDSDALEKLEDFERVVKLFSGSL